MAPSSAYRMPFLSTVAAAAAAFRWTTSKVPPLALHRFLSAGASPSSSSGEECTICPAGKHKAASGSGVCSDCGAGTFSNAGESSCTTCPTGKYAYFPGSAALDAPIQVGSQVMSHDLLIHFTCTDTRPHSALALRCQVRRHAQNAPLLQETTALLERLQVKECRALRARTQVQVRGTVSAELPPFSARVAYRYVRVCIIHTEGEWCRYICVFTYTQSETGSERERDRERDREGGKERSLTWCERER